MAGQPKLAHPRRGEVWLVSFDPTVGAEIRKTRPALILQNDTANRYSPITVVAGVTSKFEETLYPTEVLMTAPEGGVDRDSVVLLNQIRSIDKSRLIKRMGCVKRDTLRAVDRALQISLGLIEL